jgi:hypothetical protein
MQGLVVELQWKIFKLFIEVYQVLTVIGCHSDQHSNHWPVNSLTKSLTGQTKFMYYIHVHQIILSDIY